uniref:Uncharacterized protein n=1 Tax=Hucho hucho TaxID=62062 RepID=A0A4W5M2C3_9TELE
APGPWLRARCCTTRSPDAFTGCVLECFVAVKQQFCKRGSAGPGLVTPRCHPSRGAARVLPAWIGGFFQERPVLKNPFLEAALLQGYPRRHLPIEAVYSDLCVFGEQLVRKVDGWGRE